jgi:hypothetical protein
MRRVCAVYLITPLLLRLTLGNKKSIYMLFNTLRIQIALGFTVQLHAFTTPSVSFYLSLNSVKLHYSATNKKKRREY